MTSLYWNGLAFAPVNKTAAKKEAVVLRLEPAVVAHAIQCEQRMAGVLRSQRSPLAAPWPPPGE